MSPSRQLRRIVTTACTMCNGVGAIQVGLALIFCPKCGGKKFEETEITESDGSDDQRPLEQNDPEEDGNIR